MAAGLAQQAPVPVIYLSDAEAAQAKRVGDAVKNAEERNTRALAAWRSFHQVYQAAHPELPGPLLFSSDFRIAFGNNRSTTPWQAVVVELSAQDRQKAESLYRETLEAQRALDQAGQNWADNWHQLVLDHVPPSPSGITVKLQGKDVTIPWAAIAFSPDYRIAVPAW